MKLTFIQTGDVPGPLQGRFGRYVPMFEQMFDATGAGFSYETVVVHEGEPLPDPASLDGLLITGSVAGVYDDYGWLAPLRDFIRAAYAANTPMVGICFGHQIMADALGGDVRKSEKGWGLGRHSYRVRQASAVLPTPASALAIACSHQDQVITPPAEAEVLLGSDFTPNAGLLYRNGRAISLQPHPEFDDAYSRALVELRKGNAPQPTIDAALASFDKPSDSADVARWLAAFLAR